MNAKLIYPVIFLVLIIGGFYVFYNRDNNERKNNIPIEYVSSARLMEDGSKININVAETKGGLGLLFIFTYDDSSIINTLTVENTNITIPSYRIVKGVNRDWLVVTTILESGTGYIKYNDSWYITSGYFGDTQKVLSYDSKTMEDKMDTNKEVTTEVVSGTDDNALDVKVITKICTEKDQCNTTFKMNHYVWNIDKQDERKSSFVSVK